MAYKRFFLLTIGVALSLLLLLAGTAEVLLHRLNESEVATSTAVRRYGDGTALYGSALVEDAAYVKLPAVRAKKPTVVALGASRVMQFREAFFTVPFYTLGGMIDSIGGLQAEWDETTRAGHVPDYVIVDVDWDWLNPNYPHHDGLVNQDIYPVASPIARRVILYKRLYQELASSENLRASAIAGVDASADPYGGRRPLGAMAAARHSGFRSDGSYQYGQLYTPESTDARLADARERVRNANKRFIEAHEVDRAELARLSQLIADIRAKGATPIVFLPPFAHEIYEMMLADPRHSEFMLTFRAETRALMERENVIFFDFSDITWLPGASDAEATDGFHGSERAYGRICLQFAADPRLAPIIDKSYIEERLAATDHPMYIVPYDR